jgi:hypothetical protein
VALRASSSASSSASGDDATKGWIKRVFEAVPADDAGGAGVKRQLGYILGRHRANFIAHNDGACARVARVCEAVGRTEDADISPVCS